MIKALRVVLIVYGAILLVMGLGGIIFPDQISGLFGIEEVTDDIIYLAVIVSAFSISIGIWLIIAGRDPLRNIYWVKFAITKTVLFVVVELYLIIQGYVDFNRLWQRLSWMVSLRCCSWPFIPGDRRALASKHLLASWALDIPLF